MADTPVAYRLHWQDFTGRQPGIGLERPAVQTCDYKTREEAERAREGLVLGPDGVATITPVYLKRRAPARTKPPGGMFCLPVMHKRLTEW